MRLFPAEERDVRFRFIVPTMIKSRGIITPVVIEIVRSVRIMKLRVGLNANAGNCYRWTIFWLPSLCRLS